ncbi:amidase [Catalinimonas alkaloidigena]|uniref:Amidase n=1 Tax=Catalinimonas alkaloidigena TaxID=1075417 RepID=A0A1G9JFU8_9BACT|nr:amidase [Catalinimonas alkaloidigena]SDL36013.1 amidase [Catalinimonas alkaloidigena]
MATLPFPEYAHFDATGLADLIRRNELSVREVGEAAMARIERYNPALNAVVHKLYDQLDVWTQQPVAGPLAGVPFLLKDLNTAFKGAPLTAGSRALRHRVAHADSAYVRRVRAAGLVVLGLTNTPEFALMGVTEPEAYGPTRNPWQTAHTPGGSSGGAAAAVAAGMVPMAGASDGGGSIRIPAACCALFGLKPSRGRVSAAPEYGEIWQGASVPHVVSRSVRDSAAMLDLLQGAEPGDPYVITPPKRPYADEVRQEVEPLRIGWSVAHPLPQGDVHPDCQQAVAKAVRMLKEAGHTVEEVPLPWEGVQVTDAYLMMYFGEVAATVRQLRGDLGGPARPGDIEEATFTMALLGETFTAGDFAETRRQWNAIARRFGAFHERYDLMLTPTLAQPPLRVGQNQLKGMERLGLKVLNRMGAGKLLRKSGVVWDTAKKNLQAVPYTQVANLCGLPAMSVPLHWTAAGLPCGAQFIGRFGAEDVLLRLAAQLERQAPWFARRPPDYAE